MPFFSQFSANDSEIFIWKNNESENFAEVFLSAEDLDKIKNYGPKKRTEFLMVRALLTKLEIAEKLRYHPSGKPYLVGDARHISISHAYPFAAVGLAEKPLGLDLEHLHEKIGKVQERFLHPSEKIWLGGEPNLETLAVIWSAKESLYKLDERHFWSFRNHYRLQPFHFGQTANFTAQVFDENDCRDYLGKVWQVENCLLTAAWEA